MRIEVRVKPGSKKPRIEKMEDELTAYVSQRAKEGRANKAVIEMLAKYYRVSRSRVVLIKGRKSRKKIFEIGA